MAESRFIHANGINIHYFDWQGSGPTAVCLHGIAGEASTWVALGEALAPDWRVIAADLRGHGDSETPDAGYTTADFAADLEGLAAQLGLRQFVLIGHSLGALIAARYAGLYPQRLHHLVLEDPAFSIDPKAGQAIVDLLNARPASFANLEEVSVWVGSETDLMTTDAHSHRWSPERMNEYILQNLRQRADGHWEWRYSLRAVLAIIDDLRQRAYAEVMAHLSDIVCPTLLVRGADSPVCTPEEAQRISAGIPNCTVLPVPGVRHVVHTEALGPFLAAVRASLT